jgi:hypothetical protein
MLLILNAFRGNSIIELYTKSKIYIRKGTKNEY